MNRIRKAFRRLSAMIEPYEQSAHFVDYCSSGDDRLTRFQWLRFTIGEVWERRRELFCRHDCVRHKIMDNGFWQGSYFTCSKCNADLGGEGEY